MPPTRQRQMADKLVAAFNSMDVPTIMSLRSPTCMRHLLPKSMGLSSQDNATYEKSLRSLTTVFHNFHLDVQELIEDVAARKIVMLLTARGDTAAGEYLNEYWWMLEFDEKGETIVEAKEFVDTLKQRDFWPKLQECMRLALKE